MLIGLTGYAGSGKSTVAEWLEAKSFTRLKFADPLKNMIRSLLRDAGVPYEEVDDYIEGRRKEHTTPLLGGRSPRWAMQTLGTEWGRNCMGEDFWVKAAMARYQRGRVVFDDCRFQNEAEAIKDAGGIIVTIQRPGTGPVSDHESENLPGPANFVLYNDGSINDLYVQCNTLFRWYKEFDYARGYGGKWETPE